MTTAVAGRPARLLAGLPPLGGPLSLDAHLRVHGPRPRFDRRKSSGGALIREVQAVGLRGRGGAGYPLAHKLAAVAGRRGRRLLVVNGAESEPASSKDAALLTRTPHLVLDGALIAAEVVGAEQIVLWLHADPSPEAGTLAGTVRRAVDQRGNEIDGIPVDVEFGQPGYLAGESSAVVSQLAGGPARPTRSPPHATERGVDGRPTVISNVETLAQLALLARHGPDWFRAVGTPTEPGTLLVTLAGAVAQPIVLEVPFGTPIGDAVLAAEPPERPGAILVGGYAGGWLPWPYAAAVALSARGLAAAGTALGVGLLAVLPEGRCGLVETARLVGWLAGESAGQCGPCTYGLPALAGAFQALATGVAEPSAVHRLHRWAGMVAGRGLCHHPDGVAALVRSALHTFEAEVRRHLAGWPCAGYRLPPLLPLPARLPADLTARLITRLPDRMTTADRLG